MTKIEKKIIQSMRRISLYYGAVPEAFKLASVKVVDGSFKNGKPRMVTRFKCSSCGKVGLRREMDADHIVEVGKFDGSWDKYVERLFCNVSNIRIVCIRCHANKTYKLTDEAF